MQELELLKSIKELVFNTLGKQFLHTLDNTTKPLNNPVSWVSYPRPEDIIPDQYEEAFWIDLCLRIAQGLKCLNLRFCQVIDCNRMKLEGIGGTDCSPLNLEYGA